MNVAIAMSAIVGGMAVLWLVASERESMLREPVAAGEPAVQKPSAAPDKQEPAAPESKD